MSKSYLPKGSNETPFNPQMEQFSYVCGHIEHENRKLWSIVIIACLSFFLSIGISLYAVSRPDSIPVLVTMNDFGETKYVGEVSRKSYLNFTVPEVAVTFQVKNFIDLFYSMSIDKVVMNKNLQKVYHNLTTETSSKLNKIIKESNMYEDFGRYTREVIFETEPLKLSKDTYQIDFRVLTNTTTGKLINTQRIRAVITVGMFTPNENDIKDNPLGIYITSFDFKEIEISK